MNSHHAPFLHPQTPQGYSYEMNHYSDVPYAQEPGPALNGVDRRRSAARTSISSVSALSNISRLDFQPDFHPASTQEVQSYPSNAPEIYGKAPHVNENDIVDSSNIRWWNSAWLRLDVLIGFIFLYGISLIALVAIFVISQRDHGLYARWTSSHYAWKYGPTAGRFNVTQPICFTNCRV